MKRDFQGTIPSLHINLIIGSMPLGIGVAHSRQ